MNRNIEIKLIQLNKSFKSVGFDLSIIFNAMRGIGIFLRDYSEIKKQKGLDTSFPFGKFFPIFGDRYTKSGKMGGHYFHQDIYVARKIFINNPVRHIDIGSRVDGFVAHVAVFRKIEIIDIRDQISSVKNIVFKRADLMQLPVDLINTFDSISSLHAIEHFGLGRYGDPIDYNGHLKGIENITKMLIKGGKFYFAVPIGSQRIEFNGHRVFSISYLLDLFKDKYTLDSFSYVDDKGDFFEDPLMNQVDIDKNFGCNWGCGIFELTKTCE
jgi:SAM-dependent methyltransferase